MIVMIANRSNGTMMKIWKGFAVGLLVIIAAAAPACRSTKKKATPVTTTATGVTDTTSVPNVDVTATRETRVDTQPPDFVQEPAKPTVEALPTDVEQLNRAVQDRGLIRDAFFGYDEAALSTDAQAAL